MNDDFKGIWTPKEIWFLQEISNTEKYLLSVIISLSKNTGECRASNKYLADLFKLSRVRISGLLANLCKNDLIEIDIIRGKLKNVEARIISLNLSP